MSHLVVQDDERDVLLQQNAAIIVSRGEALHAGWHVSTLGAFPGARIAATLAEAGASVLSRSGGWFDLAWADEGAIRVDPVLLPSVLYAYEVAGRLREMAEQELTVLVGGRELTVGLLRRGEAQ